MIVAQTFLVLLLTIISIRAGKLPHDAVPSNIRAGVSSGAGTLSWLLFLPFSLLFGWFAHIHGVRVAGWFLTGAALAVAGLLVGSARHRAEPTPGDLQPPPAARALLEHSAE